MACPPPAAGGGLHSFLQRALSTLGLLSLLAAQGSVEERIIEVVKQRQTGVGAMGAAAAAAAAAAESHRRTNVRMQVGGLVGCTGG